MKRLIRLTSGYSSIDFSRVVDNISKFRISMFEFTGTTSAETIHLKIDNHSLNFDETTDLYYTLFFISHANGSLTYTPGLMSEGWFNTSDGLHNITVQLFINGVIADISSRNCWLEIEYA